MTFRPQNKQDYPETSTNHESSAQTEVEPILCQHCRRTANNGIKCKGMCVADSDY